MNEEQLKKTVDEIIKTGDWNPEGAHRDEDELHLELIKEFCPDWVIKEIERLNEADFPRWYA